MTVLCFEQIVPFHLYYNIIINIVIIIHYKYYVKETKGSKVHTTSHGDYQAEAQQRAYFYKKRCQIIAY